MSENDLAWAIRKMLLPSQQFIDEICLEQSEDNSHKFIPEDDFDRAIFEEFGDKIKNDDYFAILMYAALNNNKWKNKVSAPGGQISSFRANANFIASIRSKGENYLDFYCKNYEKNIDDGYVAPEIEVGMFRHGWYVDNSDY